MTICIEFSCASEPGKSLCQEVHGECLMQQDGYYYVNSVCVTIGAVLLFTYIAPTIRYLECKFPCCSLFLLKVDHFALFFFFLRC